MKKFYAIALGALVLMTACSKDDPEPTLPNLVVNETTITPAYSTLKAPALTEIAANSTGAFVAKFENGQVLTLEQQATAAGIYVLVVTNINGTANVVIPASVQLSASAAAPMTVGGFKISPYQGIGDEVRSITIPKVAAYNMQGNSVSGMTLRQMNDEFFTDLSGYAANLEAVYFEDGFPTFTSDNGVVYSQVTEGSETITTLVMVPRKNSANTRIFTVPNGVNAIGDKAFNKCSELERIIISPTVESIGNNAFDYTSSLIALDMLPVVAPKAGESAFGYDARKATLRIPNGSRTSYLLSNPFAELEPNSTHPVPGSAYLTYMKLVDPTNFADTNNYFNGSDEWDAATWAQKVPEPQPVENADTQTAQRYTNAVNAYNAYIGQLECYDNDRALWETAKTTWDAADAQKVIAAAEPRYPKGEIKAPVRPRNPGANATEEELAAYEEALAVYNTEYAQYVVFTAEKEQYLADFAIWENAKNLWESTRGYQFFKKVQEVDFQIQ